MSGAHFWWKVTLVGDQGEQGTFKLEEFCMGRDVEKQQVPRPIPYKVKHEKIPYFELSGAIPYVGKELALQAVKLTKKNPVATMDYADHGRAMSA